MTTPAQTPEPEPTRASLEIAIAKARQALVKLTEPAGEVTKANDALILYGRAERALGRLEGREATWSEVRQAPAVKRWNPAESGFEYTYLEADCPWFLAPVEEAGRA